MCSELLVSVEVEVALNPFTLVRNLMSVATCTNHLTRSEAKRQSKVPPSYHFHIIIIICLRSTFSRFWGSHSHSLRQETVESLDLSLCLFDRFNFSFLRVSWCEGRYCMFLAIQNCKARTLVTALPLKAVTMRLSLPSS